MAAGRVLVLVLAIGCGHNDPVVVDAPPHNPPAAAFDANPNLYACPQLVHLPFSALEAYDVASDNTTLYLSVRATDGTIQLQAMPVTGGTPITIATADDDHRFYLASLDDAVFYAAHLSSTEYVIHQRVAGVDTILGSVASTVPIMMAANASDLYVVGSDTDSETSLWRISRAGVTGVPPKVTTVSSPQPAAYAISIGATSVLWTRSDGVEIADIPGPSAANFVAAPTGWTVLLVGDAAFIAAGQPFSSQSYDFLIKELTPTPGPIYEHLLVPGIPEGFFSDPSHLYWSIYLPGYNETYLQEINPDGTAVKGVCGCLPGTRGQGDTTNLYGIATDSHSQWHINVIPRP